MALLNVHPDYVDFSAVKASEDQFEVKHYAEFLSWVKHNHSGDYWHALPKDVADLWRNRACVAIDGKVSR
jgi:hypothetical protein